MARTKEQSNFIVFCNIVNGRLENYSNIRITYDNIRNILVCLIFTTLNYFDDRNNNIPIDFINSNGFHLYGLAADKYQGRPILYIGRDLKSVTDSCLISTNVYNFYNILYNEINTKYGDFINYDINKFYDIMNCIMFELEEYFMTISSKLSFYDTKYSYLEGIGKIKFDYSFAIYNNWDGAIRMAELGVIFD